MSNSNTNPKSDYYNSISEIFNQTNVMYLLVFLAVYGIIYAFISLFHNNNGNPANSQLFLSRSIDFIVLALVLFIGISYFYTYTSKNDTTNILGWFLKWTRDFFDDPNTLVEIIVSIFLLYILIYICRVPMALETKPITISFIESKLWVFLATIMLLDFFKYILGINLLDIIFNGDFLQKLINQSPNKTTQAPNKTTQVPNKTTQAPSVKTDSKSSSGVNEVFNISNNMYTYDDAQAICQAYGAKIATYDQIENAYDNGGEWCNYGWSDNQMALFPTQRSTWNKLQSGPDEYKNNCGRPGINGGYISNKNVKFGVNCYGVKPPASKMDLERMDQNSEVVVPQTLDQRVLQAKVNFWKENAANMLVINSYNRNEWSEY